MFDSDDQIKIARPVQTSVGLNFGPVLTPEPRPAPTLSQWDRAAKANERTLITEDLGLYPHDHDVPYLDHWPTDMPCQVGVSLYSRTRMMKVWELHKGAGKMILINGVWYGVKRG